jgi:integrase
MGELRQRGAVWWIRYYRNGKRHEESSHSAKKQVAIDLLKIREGDIAKGIPVSPAMLRLTFDDAAADLLTEYAVNGRRSADALERRIRLGLRPFFGGRVLVSVTARDIRRYVDERQRAGWSNATVNRELAALKRMFSLARKSRRLLADHVPHIALLREDNVRRGFFEPASFAAVCRHLPAPLQPLVQFAYLTGWRVKSEVLPLEWRQVDWHARVVRLEPGVAKNREGRSFPFTRALVALLEAQQAAQTRLEAQGVICPYVFHRQGQRIRTFRRAWLSACRQAGVPGRIPHDFRRTAARNLELAGVSRSAAMAMVGHKTESIYRRYAIVEAGALRAAASKLDAVATGTIWGQSGDSDRRRRGETD